MPQQSSTKIIATIGPSSWSKEILTKIIEEGVDIARINASFANKDEIQRVTEIIREISPKVAIMLDLMGHKIRVEGIEKAIEVKEGQEIRMVPQTTQKTLPGYIAITYSDLFKYVKGGESILIDDGTIKLVVASVNGKEVICKVLVGGIIKPKKTINIPNVYIDFGALTEKDKQDIQYAKENNLDLIAASFIRNAKDIQQVKDEVGDFAIKLVSKIEDGQGVANVDEILNVTDAVMVARGDMGVELPFEKIPEIQKELILKCRQRGKSVIVATQMLESMKENATPTRAEITDVANAVLDGADCLMLSAETSTGKYPVEAVEAMTRIINEAEQNRSVDILSTRTDAKEETDAICRHVANMGRDLPIKAVVVLTHTGKTAASLSRHRLPIPIYAVCPNLLLLRQLNLFFGVTGIYVKDFASHRDEIIKQAVTTVYSKGNLDLEDKVAIISGSSIYNKSINSILEIVSVKEVLG